MQDSPPPEAEVSASHLQAALMASDRVSAQQPRFSRFLARRSIICRALFHFTSEEHAIRKPDETRINREITEKEVRLIGADGSQIGVVSIEEALKMAEQAALDLVEVAPEVKPPVCKIYDYKKVLYEKKKKLKESKKKARQMELKEVKMRVVIDSHDRQTKEKHAREFLEKGDKVKFTIIYRGREITKPELGDKLIQQVTEDLKDIGELEGPPSKMGKQIILIMGRRKDWVPPKA